MLLVNLKEPTVNELSFVGRIILSIKYYLIYLFNDFILKVLLLFILVVSDCISFRYLYSVN